MINGSFFQDYESEFYRLDQKSKADFEDDIKLSLEAMRDIDPEAKSLRENLLTIPNIERRDFALRIEEIDAALKFAKLNMLQLARYTVMESKKYGFDEEVIHFSSKIFGALNNYDYRIGNDNTLEKMVCFSLNLAIAYCMELDKRNLESAFGEEAQQVFVRLSDRVKTSSLETFELLMQRNSNSRELAESMVVEAFKMLNNNFVSKGHSMAIITTGIMWFAWDTSLQFNTRAGELLEKISKEELGFL